MKNAFLVLNDPSNKDSGLHVASIKEWNQILEINRTLPRDQRRFFIKDSFEDCGEIDCMYIETTREEYDKWHSQQVYAQKKRKLGEQYGKVSFQDTTSVGEGLTYEEVIGNGVDLEEAVIKDTQLEALKQSLAEWKPWALDVLTLYLSEKKEEATLFISKKCRVSIRTAQRWKIQFEEFVMNFFENF